MGKQQPIGIFDSGVGGTSIWREIHSLLPMEQTLYLADSANAPYGEKSKQEIIDLSVKNTRKLLEMDSKIIVVACNTATTNAIKHLRNEFNVPFIGIEPAIKPAALNSQTRVIGILATRGTLSSELFAETSDLYSQYAKVVEVVGTGLVKAIERGELKAKSTELLLRNLLSPLLEANIDYLVLGCSHYPYLIPLLKEILPQGVKIIDSGLAVANQTKNVLENLDLLADDQQCSPEFFTNAAPEVLKALVCAAGEECRVSYLEF